MAKRFTNFGSWLSKGFDYEFPKFNLGIGNIVLKIMPDLSYGAYIVAGMLNASYIKAHDMGSKRRLVM